MHSPGAGATEKPTETSNEIRPGEDRGPYDGRRETGDQTESGIGKPAEADSATERETTDDLEKRTGFGDPETGSETDDD